MALITHDLKRIKRYTATGSESANVQIWDELISSFFGLATAANASGVGAGAVSVPWLFRGSVTVYQVAEAEATAAAWYKREFSLAAHYTGNATKEYYVTTDHPDSESSHIVGGGGTSINGLALVTSSGSPAHFYVHLDYTKLSQINVCTLEGRFTSGISISHA